MFGLGLVLVVLDGAELFTGYIGNFIGAIGTALLAGQYLAGHGQSPPSC